MVSRPGDFRKGLDGLAACVANSFQLDPYSGAIYVFRSRRADRVKILVWAGSGLVLVMKRLQGKRFTWPKPQTGPVILTKVQFDALLDGIDWTKVASLPLRNPVFL
ncbi:IS66 family insertion sequence element accessory protein TnpB [Sagittula sp. NFXS13]